VDEIRICEDFKFGTLLFFGKGMGFRFRLDFKFKSLIFLVGWDSDSIEIYNSGRTRRFFFAMWMRLGFVKILNSELYFFIGKGWDSDFV
jgi:hypothetical protein